MAEQIKGRLYKARQRGDARWRRDRVVRCQCGKPYTSDPDGSERTCPYGNCVLFYCPDCGRNMGGFGPMGCLCDSRPGGHRRYAEQRRPGVRKKYRDKRARRRHWWELHPDALAVVSDNSSEEKSDHEYH